MDYQSVLFVDLDGTILKGPFDVVFPVVFNEVAAQASLTVESAQQRIIQESRNRQQNPNLPPTQAIDWDDVVATVAHQVGLTDWPPDFVSQTLQHYLAPPHTQLLDDADQLLPQLANPQRALVAVTKGLAKYQKPLLTALGLVDLFTDVITLDTNNVGKDDVRFYATWRNRARTRLIVGDQYQDDVVYPHGFGFKTIWKPEGSSAIDDPFERAQAFDHPEGETIRPDAIIFSLRELPRVVEKLETLR